MCNIRIASIIIFVVALTLNNSSFAQSGMGLNDSVLVSYQSIRTETIIDAIMDDQNGCPDSIKAYTCSENEFKKAYQQTKVIKDYRSAEDNEEAAGPEEFSCIEYHRSIIEQSAMKKYIRIENSASIGFDGGFYFELVADNGVQLRVPCDCESFGVKLQFLPELSLISVGLSQFEANYGNFCFNVKNGDVTKLQGEAFAMLSDSTLIFVKNFMHGMDDMFGIVPTVSIYDLMGNGHEINLDMVAQSRNWNNCDKKGNCNWVFSDFALENNNLFVKFSNIVYEDDYVNFKTIDTKYFKIPLSMPFIGF